MRSDEVYRFHVLRDPGTRASDEGKTIEVDARFVDAYGSSGTTAFGDVVAALLAAGGIGEARDAAAQVLSQWQPDDFRAVRVRLAAGAALRDDLRVAAVANDDKRALERLDDLDALGLANVDGGLDDLLDAWRADVGDILVAGLLLDTEHVDRADACASICAAEAAVRLVRSQDANNDELPWQPAVFHGVVVLPFEVMSAAPRRSSMTRYAKAFMVNRTLTPAELLSSNAVRCYVGDLIVIDQQLREYELGEIAHVENVLLSEEYKRVHRDLKRVQIEVMTLTESETINERDLQSTDRDELRSELSKAVREDIRFGADVSATVSGKMPNGEYSVGVGASFSYARSTEQREQAAHSHVREVVDRARQQITERTRASRSTTTTTEDEDRTIHGFDNTEGDDHVVGVYRWIEKHYDLHLINYGRRLFYEFVLPDPAAYWRAVSARRSLVAAGPIPRWPELPGVGGADPEPLDANHLALTDANGNQLDFPERWNELVELAAQWGVALERPPSAVSDLTFEISVAPLTDDTTDKEIHAFGAPGNFFYESGMPRTTVPERAPKVPDGFEAISGEVAFTGWMVVSKAASSGGVPAFTTWRQFERGYAWLQLGGRQEVFSIGVAGSGPETRSMTNIFPDGNHVLIGDIPVALTTTLNGALCSCKLHCRRLPAAVTVWVSKTLDQFATAYAARLEEHGTAAKQSELDQRQRDFVRTDATYRAIERRELKRQIIDLLLADSLEALGEVVERAMPSSPSGEVDPAPLNADELPTYTKIVNFFEQAFDWTNLVYIFAPYFFGRKEYWEASALADESDPQFSAFIGAGAVRVQVPARLGFESYVDTFFSGLGALDLTQSVPWLPTGRPIALDLAGAAQDGFELWPGRVSVPANSTTATVTGNTFTAADDTNRELRIDGRIFKIVDVVDPTHVVLDRAIGGPALNQVEYERGGVVVGPTIALTLPSTLVAIDMPNLALPNFPGRYV